MQNKKIGPYELLKVLGQGGMGVVYKARHESSGQVVALKTIKAVSEGVLSSLRREIHALARLKHPGIVGIVEQGVENGSPWYAMELLEGVPLKKWASQNAEPEDIGGPAVGQEDAVRQAEAGQDAGQAGRRPVQEILTLLLRLCSGLGYLHGEGIVHRDLKPDNIVVKADGTPVLVDFGLASQFSGDLSREVLAVDAGGSGTAAYMAPEQLKGEFVDARADLYALGCILYELLTGQRLFSGLGMYQLMAAHLFQPAPRPSKAASWVTPSQEELTLRLLKKKPRERLGYAQDVAEQLKQIGAHAGPEAGWPCARPYLYRPGFAGRAGQLGQWRARLAGMREALAEGRPASGGFLGGMVLLAGESGAGKTRLLMELGREEAAEGTLLLAGECEPNAREALHGLRKPLQTLVDRCRGMQAQQEAERVFGAQGPVLAMVLPEIRSLAGQDRYPPLADLPPKEAALRLFHALAEVFAAVASPAAQEEGQEVTPILFIVDDLQWADELTLGFLEYWARQEKIQQLPMLLIGAYRSEEKTDGIERLMQARRVAHEELGRLDQMAVGSMVVDMLALPAAPPSFSEFLQRNSEGNPFFVAEYLRTAVAEGLLWRDEQGVWQIGEAGQDDATRESYERLPLPRSIRDLVGRRMSDLPPESVCLLQALAVLGREESAALAGLVSGLGEEQRLEAISELMRRQVLETLPTGHLRFLHDKLREVGYERIDALQKPLLHRAAAEGIEALYAEELASRQAMLGHHWEKAGDAAKAMPYYLQAARQAVQSYAHEEAERLYRAYLRLVDAATAESITARNELGEKVLQLRGRSLEALECHQQAVDEARRLGLKSLEAKGLRFSGKVQEDLGQMDEALGSMQQSLAVAREIGDLENEGAVLGSMGSVHSKQGRRSEAKEVYEQALSLYRQLGNRVAEGKTLGSLAHLCYEQSQNEEAKQLFEKSLVILRETGARREEATILGQQANFYFHIGQIGLAQELYEQNLLVLRESGDLKAEGTLLGNLGLLHLDQGRFDEARQHFEKALGIHRETGFVRHEASTLSYLGNLCQQQAQREAAIEFYEQALSLFKALQDPVKEGILLLNFGGVYMDLLRFEEAGKIFQQALNIFQELNDEGMQANVFLYLGLLQRNLGHLEQARQMYEQALTIHRKLGNQRYIGMLLNYLLQLEHLTSETMEVPQKLAQEAEEILHAVHDVHELGGLWFVQGCLELWQGRSAQNLLDKMQDLAREIQASSDTELCTQITSLQRSIQAAEAGERHRLYRGQWIEDIPENVRRALRESGQLPKDQM